MQVRPSAPAISSARERAPPVFAPSQTTHAPSRRELTTLVSGADRRLTTVAGQPSKCPREDAPTARFPPHAATPPPFCCSGFSPLFGLKALLAIFFAWLTRSNILAAVLASALHDIVLPLMPVVYSFEYGVGYLLLSHPHHWPHLLTNPPWEGLHGRGWLN